MSHYMSAESLLPWQHGAARGDYRDILMVAGSDLYGYKGIEEVAKARLRPDGRGGCERPEDS